MVELLVFWLVMAAVVGVIAHGKGYDGVGWGFYGALLWPVALVHILVRPRSEFARQKAMAADGRLPCPECAEPVLAAARTCPHCRSRLAEGWSGGGSGPGPAGKEVGNG